MLDAVDGDGLHAAWCSPDVRESAIGQSGIQSQLVERDGGQVANNLRLN